MSSDETAFAAIALAKEVRLQAPYRKLAEVQTTLIELNRNKAAMGAPVTEADLLPIWFIDDAEPACTQVKKASYIQIDFVAFLGAASNTARPSPLLVQLIVADTETLVVISVALCYLTKAAAVEHLRLHLIYWLREASNELTTATKDVARQTYNVYNDCNAAGTRKAYIPLLAGAELRQKRWQEAVQAMTKALCKLK